MATKLWISQDPAMVEVVDLARKASSCRSNVLIVGESGVGKTYIAQKIHQASLVSRQGFHMILCPSGMDDADGWDLMEALRGISTSGGTVLLKCVDTLSIVNQRRLLGLLDRRASEGPLHPNLRFMFTAHSSVEDRWDLKPILPELRFRISVITIEVPPLRNRPLDVILLAKIFLKEFAQEQNKVIERMTASAKSLLVSQSWRGNIWELRAVINNAVSLCDKGGVIDAGIVGEALRLAGSLSIPNRRLGNVRNIAAQFQ